jgi:hypothetical protein
MQSKAALSTYRTSEGPAVDLSFAICYLLFVIRPEGPRYLLFAIRPEGPRYLLFAIRPEGPGYLSLA